MIEKLGDHISGKVDSRPAAARRMLAAAWSLVGWKGSHFPSKERCASQEYLQAVVSNLLSKMIRNSKDAAFVNIFMPCEIFHAMDMKVMTPEAFSIYIVCTAAERAFLDTAERNGTPETLCSIHKALIGACESGVCAPPALVVNTTLACDANQLTFREIAGHWGVPHHVIDVPYSVSEESVAYVADQLRALVPAVEEAAHRKLSEEKLREAVARSGRTLNNYLDYLAMRPEKHLPETLTPELLSSIANHIFLGNAEAETYSRMLLADLRKAQDIGDRKRVLWMHVTPNWQDDLKQVFQYENVEIIGCDMAYDVLGCGWEMPEPDPWKPYESMARRLVYDTFNGAGERRIEATLEKARSMKADGAVVFCQWGCKQTQGIAVRAKKVLEENGIPTLIIDGDAADRANGGGGQILTRCRAFTEMLTQAGAGKGGAAC